MGELIPTGGDPVVLVVGYLLAIFTILALALGLKTMLTQVGKRAVLRDFEGPPARPETNAEREQREMQEMRDANRATWDAYDRDLEAQRDALKATPPAHPYMINLSTGDYLWYFHVPEVHMPWRYLNVTTRHIEVAPSAPKLEWGWRRVGVGHASRSLAEHMMMRIVNPDENYYVYDAGGLAQGRVPPPEDTDED